ncbi:hypothetical protein DFQ28_006689 [Apophysomyces sp. BC1034]|nr:hypothetical protein DFQ28_006689 [Apophysomyces sp. BC1034]
MSARFFYEDGQGTVVDEHDRPKPMDYVINEEQYALEVYLRNKPRERDHESYDIQTKDAKRGVDDHTGQVSAKRVYTLDTDQDKVGFLKLWFEKYLNASTVTKQLGIMFVQLKYGPNSSKDILIATSRSVRRMVGQRIPNEEHKKVISEYIYENPSVVLGHMMEQLLQRSGCQIE